MTVAVKMPVLLKNVVFPPVMFVIHLMMLVAKEVSVGTGFVVPPMVFAGKIVKNVVQRECLLSVGGLQTVIYGMVHAQKKKVSYTD